MTGLADRRTPGRASSRGGPLRRVSMAAAQLVTSAALVVSIIIAGIAVSLGIAGAQVTGGAVEPDAGLLLAMLGIAIAAMGILSAAAVRFTGRPRGR